MPEDTVTVPRWALEYVLESVYFGAPGPDVMRLSRSYSALKRALDAKTEMPDEPGHHPLTTGWQQGDTRRATEDDGA
jgi:hypothetical protein